MNRFELIQFSKVLSDIQKFTHQGMFVVAILKRLRTEFRDCAKNFDNQDTVISDDSPATFADNIRMWDFLRITDVANVVNDVIRIFLERVVRGTIKCRPAAIIIDTQSATDIDVLNLETHLVKLRIIAGSFLDSLLNRKNIRDLRADMEVNQLEAMGKVFKAKEFNGSQHFDRVETELGVLSAAFRPFACALAKK